MVKPHFWEEEPLLTVRRIIYVVFIGWWLGLVFAIIGLVFALTIIGIPVALVFWHFARFVFMPVGFRAVARDPTSTSPLRNPRSAGAIVLNILWLITLGIPLTILLLAVTIVMAFTIVGLPLVFQFPKLAKFLLWPIGHRIVSVKKLPLTAARETGAAAAAATTAAAAETASTSAPAESAPTVAVNV